MQESGRPFDHDWGPLVDKDFESKPIFHCELMDSDMNYFMDLDESMESSSPEMEFRGSIAERRAAKFGFDASRINVAQFRICSSPPSSSPSRSPYLTIPPGISPAALLESPVMLPNSQPSPTTGTFPLASCNHDCLTVKPVSSSGADEGKDGVIDSFAKLKCPGDPTTSAENQALHFSKSPSDSGKLQASIKSCDITESTKAVDKPWNAADIDTKPCNGGIANTQMPQLRECIEKETMSQHPLGEDQKGAGVSTAGMTRNAEDGYCWRKYGQKHVKGSEYPRSYYKCNNSNCPVKKKVERSHDGEITEIIYNGAHNHPKPQPRLSLGRQASSGGELETSEGIGSCPKVEGGAGWRCNQLNSKDFKVNADWRAYCLERTSSTYFLNEIPDPMSISHGKTGSVFGSVENHELGSTIPSREGEDEDGATQGSTSPGDDVDGDESEPKRRKKEIFSAEAYLPSRSTREPRIILQIESEIDVLDDGYRWRKYGQKVVKGNPNPRSYYKCTSAGCPVRKHVERASEDLKSVITTYEGKHNHEVPTAKTNVTSSLGNSPPNVSGPHSILALPRNHSVSNPEMQVQDLSLHYQMKPDFSQSNLLVDLVSDMKLGAASIYQMKFPPLQSPMPYSPFVINSNRSETHTSCIAAPVMPEFRVAVPMNIPRSANVAVSSSFHSNNHSRIGGSVQSSIGNQQMKEKDLRFFKPKEEQKDDHLYDSSLATPPDNANATSSTVFCRATGNFPP